MGFYRVPINNGVLDIDYLFLIEGRTVMLDTNSNGLAVVWLRDGVEERETWQKLTQDEYLAYCSGGQASVNKSVIQANGIDTTVVTVECHFTLTAISFYHTDTGELIATVPVDPEAHTATLQVTATTPGVIRIRAGEPTITRLNEVIIHAVEAD